jgi:hypothetical protein
MLAAAAGLALCGSVAKADFSISAVKSVGPTIGSQTTDVYDFILSNNGANSTGTTINSIDIALLSSQGMYIGVRSGGRGDLFYTSAASANDSWISDQAFNTPPTSLTSGGNGNLTTTAGGTILLLGQDPATNAGTSNSATTFTANQLVQGISGAIVSSSGADSSPLWFARAVVPTDSVVTLLNPGGTASTPTPNATRLFEPNSGVVSPLVGSFAPINDSGTSGPFVVPEPSSFALVGIGAAGLMSRRRRTA